MNSIKQRVILAILLAPAFAQAAVDTTVIEAKITEAGAACALVGAAVLVVHYGIKVYHWIRRAG